MFSIITHLPKLHEKTSRHADVTIGGKDFYHFMPAKHIGTMGLPQGANMMKVKYIPTNVIKNHPGIPN
jgi:hypothetical protein